MGFLDDLNKFRHKGQPTAPTNTDNPAESKKTASTLEMKSVDKLPVQYVTTPDMNEKVEKAAGNMKPLDVGTSLSPVNKPDIFKNKPETMSNTDWQRLLRVYPEDRILQYYNKPFEPDSSDGLFTRIFQENIDKPKELDEKKLNNAKLLGSLGDAASLVIQMLSANGDGAYIRNRDYKDTASGMINSDERDLRKLYAMKRDKYNADLFNVRLKDIMQGYNEHNAMQQNINRIIAQGDKLDFDRNKFLTQMQFNQQKDDRNHDFKLLQEQNREKDRKAKLGIQYGNLEQNKRRTDAYIKRTGSGSNAGYEMRIDAHGKDNEAVKDEFGNPVRVIQLTKGQVDQYAQKALQNPSFIERHPELMSKNDLTGKVDHETKDRLARAYIQDWYDAQTGKEQLSNIFDSISGYGSRFLSGLSAFGSMMGNETESNEVDEFEEFYYPFED